MDFTSRESFQGMSVTQSKVKTTIMISFKSEGNKSFWDPIPPQGIVICITHFCRIRHGGGAGRPPPSTHQ